MSGETILLVEDDRELRAFLEEVMTEAGHRVIAVPSADRALGILTGGGGEPDLVVSDLMLPGMRGHELLREVRRLRPDLHVVVITAFGAIDSAIELVKAGAYDYLTKPFGTDEFLLTLDGALEDSRVRRERARLSREALHALPGFVGGSRAMQELFRLIQRAAPSAFPALITGESGTGKELVARALHEGSGRGPFIVVNCAALPEHLLESELFGHEKGAFSGADRENRGLFQSADGGTLFLDEIGELPTPLQPKLLRALENGEVRPVGSTRSRTVDVRVVTATNRDLEEEVAAGRFRADLYWRLNVVHLHVPALRERPADIPLLAEHFLAQRSITPEAMAVLTAYPWPGNARELRNALERAATLSATGEIGVEDLPPRVREAGRAAALLGEASRKELSMRDMEKAYILQILGQVGGNKSRAAEILELDRKTLYRKLEEWGETGGTAGGRGTTGDPDS
jgi:DNA-binding NtrC family response regulator